MKHGREERVHREGGFRKTPTDVDKVEICVGPTHHKLVAIHPNRHFNWCDLLRPPTHELDCAGGVAAHALGDGRGTIELVRLQRVGCDLVEGDDRHSPEKHNATMST